MESSRSYSRELRAFRRELFLVLPNHYQPPAPLPNYDELCGATVHQKNVHTGPTEFRGSSWARIYGWFTSGINASAVRKTPNLLSQKYSNLLTNGIYHVPQIIFL